MAKTPILDKQDFVHYVNFIKKTCEKDNALSEAIEKACDGGDAFVIGLYSSEYITMTELLSLVMGLEVGTYDGNVLEYFIQELNFGKNYKADCYTEPDGTPIDISTAEKLYDYIVAKGEKDD